MSRWPSIMATIIILIGGYLTLAWATNGWATWTAESARRLAILDNPKALPDAGLQDAEGRLTSFSEFDRPVLLIDFIYTKCPTVCVAMGAEFRQWQSDLITHGLTDDVQLLSLTFDPNNDGPKELEAYLSRFSANDQQWVAARFNDNDLLDEVLEGLGVVVIPEPTVGFVHNAAIYLVHNQTVFGIYDFDDRDALLKAIKRQLKQVEHV